MNRRIESRPLLLLGALAWVLAVSGCAAPPTSPDDGPWIAAASTPASVASAVFVVVERAAREGERLNVLALSGGGQNGAFGAGVLSGWRRSGRRPDAHLVTGVSTGAFLATFAFLDTVEADDTLHRMYTEVSRDDVLEMRSRLAAVWSDAVSSAAPLERLVERWFTDRVIDQVAARSRGGARLLLVGTTNLEEGCLQLWNMSALAEARRYDLYRRVLLASASIPVLFPPVELGGRLHVDGGVRQHAFTPYGLLTDAQRDAIERLGRASGWSRDKGTVHVLVNSPLELHEQQVSRGLGPLAGRSVALLLDSALLANLWRQWAQSAAEAVEFRLTSIPEDMREAAGDSMAFDQANMRALYDRGEAMGRHPETCWTSTPPLQQYAGRSPAPSESPRDE